MGNYNIMRALIFDHSLRFDPSYPDPVPKPGEALIKVSMAGICRTDLEIARGYMGFSGVLGHEFVGVVCQSPRSGLLGRRVVGEINCGCGKCPWCLQGLARHCPQRTVIGILGRDGALAEYVSLPVNNLHLVPDGVNDLEAVFVEPLAAAFEILEQAHIKPGQRVLVLGDGKLGLLAAQVLRLPGAQVLLAGKHPHKLEVARNLGLDVCQADQLPNEQFDAVIESTGSESGLSLAIKKTKPRGIIIQKSTIARQICLDIAPLVIGEIALLGSRCGPFAPALQALAHHQVQVKPLISGQFPLDAGIEGFEQAARRDSLKVIINV